MNLGIDLGTSEVKAVLCDVHGELLASAARPLALSCPRPGWSEQQPEDWWNAVDEAVLGLREQAPAAMGAVQAIGLAGQMHGAVVLDARGQIVRPAILWNDGRSEPQCKLLEAKAPDSRAITGNIAMPGFTAPKLLWLREHEPELFRRIATVLLPKDWLRLRLCGEAFTDLSDASGTLWLDVAARDWSDTLLQACGLDRSFMPKLREGTQPAGQLSASITQRWGIARPPVIAAGAGDNAAAAVGMRAVESGQGFVSLGTSGVVFVVTDSFRPRPEQTVHAFCHAVPQRWHQMSVTLSCAASLNWLAQVLGRPAADLAGLADGLSDGAKSAAPLFLPYLNGERTPFNDAKASGVFLGLRATHAAADLAYAVMEGVAFSLADGVRVLREGGTELSSLRVVGGGSRSDGWVQLVASATGVTLLREDEAASGAAVGAAYLGHAARWGILPARRPRAARHFTADCAQVDQLAPRLARYRRLYPALAPEFARDAGG